MCLLELVTQLNAPLHTTEEYSAEEGSTEFLLDNLSYNLFKNTNKSDVLYAAGKAVGIGWFI